MTQDDRMETITDPAEIRATSDERGCCDCRTFDQHERECILPDERTTPAPVGAAVALDLDAIEAAALADDGWWSVPAFALVAEVRRLAALCIPLTDLAQELDMARQNLHHSRAMSSAHFERAERENARAESAEAEVVTLRARLAEAEALHWKVGGACSHCSQRSDYAVAWPCETAVALAVTTGEGE